MNSIDSNLHKNIIFEIEISIVKMALKEIFKFAPRVYRIFLLGPSRATNRGDWGPKIGTRIKRGPCSAMSNAQLVCTDCNELVGTKTHFLISQDRYPRATNRHDRRSLALKKYNLGWHNYLTNPDYCCYFITSMRLDWRFFTRNSGSFSSPLDIFYHR